MGGVPPTAGHGTRPDPILKSPLEYCAMYLPPGLFVPKTGSSPAKGLPINVVPVESVVSLSLSLDDAFLFPLIMTRPWHLSVMAGSPARDLPRIIAVR